MAENETSGQDQKQVADTLEGDGSPSPSENPKAALARKLEADIAKATADYRKTDLEIRELTRWYLRPAILQPWATIVIGIVTALVGVANGWFSTKLESLNNKEVEVQRNIDQLNSGRSNLNRQVSQLLAERNSLKLLLNQTASRAQQLSAKITALQTGLKNTKKNTSNLANLKKTLDEVSTQAEAATSSRSSSVKQLLSNGTRASFVADDDYTGVDAAGHNCSLTPGDVLQYDQGPLRDAKTASVTVLSSKSTDCKISDVVSFSVSDLQKMQDSFERQLDKGMEILSGKQSTSK